MKLMQQARRCIVPIDVGDCTGSGHVTCALRSFSSSDLNANQLRETTGRSEAQVVAATVQAGHRTTA